MYTLPILQQNAYLSLVISDNGIWSHLAYTDHNANREYIISDFTDLNPLKQRLDDDFFTQQFWYEYFDNLEKVFNWNIVDKNIYGIFTFRKFQNEGDGLGGIRVLVDENQKFFNQIFTSLRSFSNDISLRIVDDGYIYSLLEKISPKLEYDDILFVQMDLANFKIYRAQKIQEKDKQSIFISKTKISWDNEYGIIDSIRDGRYKAFLATDIPMKDMSNYWANFTLNRVFVSEDPNIKDMLRAYTTIQCHSIYQENIEKLQNFGTKGKCAVVCFGLVPTILGKQKTLLSMIDGLELTGTFDYYQDNEKKVLSYGKTYAESPSGSDIVLTRKDVISCATKVIIPEVRQNKNQKVILNGYTDSISLGRGDFFALYPEFTFIQLPLHKEKLVVDGDFKNGAYIKYPEKTERISFISVPGKQMYDSVLIDGRTKPIVYGPDVYSNKLKLEIWMNDIKA